MAASIYPSKHHFASDFVVSAGCILFRKESSVLQICVLHDIRTNNWLLPKGRKDTGEAIEHAAVRETFEETGYPCTLLPCKMQTRTPQQGVNQVEGVSVQDGITEPFAVTVRDRGSAGTKFIWWYIARTTGQDKVLGTQTATELFESHFVPADEAIGRLTFANDRDLARKALEIVRDGNGEGL